MMNKLALTILVAASAHLMSTGGVKTNDWSWVRGTHYRINGDAAKTARELGYGKRVGLNAVRFWVSQADFKSNPKAAANKYVTFVRQAWQAGYYSMPILFNGNGLDPAMLEGDAWGECAEYAKAVVEALKDEPGLLMWDVMNEPTYNSWIGNAPDEPEKERRHEKTRKFIRRACDYVKELDPGSFVTLGCASAAEAEKTEPCVDVLSFHDYSGTRREIESNYARMETFGNRVGKGVMQTETGCTAYGNGYDMALEACERHKFGWFFFNLVISGYTETFHGVFYDDGTVRDPSAIAAMMGCYRQRDLGKIIPASPVKPGKEDRLDAVIATLRGEIAKAGSNGKMHEKLFDGMERAANYLETCELVPMNVPPTARIDAWRKMDEPPVDKVRSFAAALAGKLEKHCK